MTGILNMLFASYVKPLEIGDAYEGGFYAGEISTAGNGVADYRLVVAPKSSGQDVKQWKTSNTDTAGTNSVIDGPSNSSTMNNASHPAAQFCEGLTIGGYSDWYSPAKNELEVLYYNLKPTTTNNVTTSGINANAVPERTSNYTTGDPAQTSATDFQTGNTEAFDPNAYWTSTQFGVAGFEGKAWVDNFSNGDLSIGDKTTSARVRAIRRVAI